MVILPSQNTAHCSSPTIKVTWMVLTMILCADCKSAEFKLELAQHTSILSCRQTHEKRGDSGSAIGTRPSIVSSKPHRKVSLLRRADCLNKRKHFPCPRFIIRFCALRVDGDADAHADHTIEGDNLLAQRSYETFMDQLVQFAESAETDGNRCVPPSMAWASALCNRNDRAVCFLLLVVDLIDLQPSVGTCSAVLSLYPEEDLQPHP